MIKKMMLMLLVAFTLSTVTSAQKTTLKDDLKSFDVAYKDYQKSGTSVAYDKAISEFQSVAKKYDGLDNMMEKMKTLLSPECFNRCDANYQQCISLCFGSTTQTCIDNCAMARLACYTACLINE